MRRRDEDLKINSDCIRKEGNEVIYSFSYNGFTYRILQEFGLFLADFTLILGHDARIAPSISG